MVTLGFHPQTQKLEPLCTAEERVLQERFSRIIFHVVSRRSSVRLLLGELVFFSSESPVSLIEENIIPRSFSSFNKSDLKEQYGLGTLTGKVKKTIL